MKIELSQDELNLLIECVTESKNKELELLDSYWDEEFIFIGDITDLTNYIDSLYNIKFKLCKYSIEYQEEN